MVTTLLAADLYYYRYNLNFPEVRHRDYIANGIVLDAGKGMKKLDVNKLPIYKKLPLSESR